MARVAYSPANWHDVLFERVMDDVASTEYHGIEGNAAMLAAFEHQIPRARALLRETSLTLPAIPLVSTFFERDDRENELLALQRIADFLGALDIHGIVLFRTARHPGRRDMVAGQPPLLPLDASRMGRLADRLTELSDRCRDMGLQGAFQNRVGTYIETPDEYLTLADRTDPELVGMAPDLGHWAYAGGDVDELVRDHRQRIIYPRLKGFEQAVFDSVVEERQGFVDFVRSGGFTPLGGGSLDLEPTLMRFERADYAGWVCVELEPLVTDDPRAAAQTSREWLRTHLHW
jgi:sugar phosphate isomerase/epimerase